VYGIDMSKGQNKQTSPWRLIADDPPPCDTSFVIAADGRWMRAIRGNKPVIVVEWLPDQQLVLMLEEARDRYWMEVPMQL
jgi:hypothetical protein